MYAPFATFVRHIWDPTPGPLLASLFSLSLSLSVSPPPPSQATPERERNTPFSNRLDLSFVIRCGPVLPVKSNSPVRLTWGEKQRDVLGPRDGQGSRRSLPRGSFMRIGELPSAAGAQLTR